MFKKSFGFHTNIILNTMCMLVDADYSKIDMQKHDWFLLYQWDEKTETKFRDWLADYIHKVKSAQWELYGTRYMKKGDCIKAANMFVLSYGWKIK